MHGPGVRGRRSRCGDADRPRSSTCVESAVSHRFEARRDGYEEPGRGHTTSAGLRFADPMMGVFHPCNLGFCFHQGGGNGGGCRRLQPGDGASSGVSRYPDARVDAMGPPTSGWSQCHATGRASSLRSTLCSSALSSDHCSSFAAASFGIWGATSWTTCRR
jgi:hypothetical protein